MDRAIKEIVTGIVQRSVSIATQTTKELVLKDYAMESDQTRILLAAHLMVASLAPSLAHMKADVDEYLKTRQQGSSFLTELMQNLVRLPNEAASAGTRYNVPLINSLVLYVGMQCRCLSLCWIVLRDPTVLMLFCLTSVLVM
ncbi:hypothetical protein ACFXTH_040532 [Malus domestica]